MKKLGYNNRGSSNVHTQEKAVWGQNQKFLSTTQQERPQEKPSANTLILHFENKEEMNVCCLGHQAAVFCYDRPCKLILISKEDPILRFLVDMNFGKVLFKQL